MCFSIFPVSQAERKLLWLRHLGHQDRLQSGPGGTRCRVWLLPAVCSSRPSPWAGPRLARVTSSDLRSPSLKFVKCMPNSTLQPQREDSSLSSPARAAAEFGCPSPSSGSSCSLTVPGSCCSPDGKGRHPACDGSLLVPPGTGWSPSRLSMNICY